MRRPVRLLVRLLAPVRFINRVSVEDSVLGMALFVIVHLVNAVKRHSSDRPEFNMIARAILQWQPL